MPTRPLKSFPRSYNLMILEGLPKQFSISIVKPNETFK